MAISECLDGRLFLAGVIPGLMMMVGLMIVVWIISRKRGYQPAAKERPKAREIWRAVVDAKWALLFPVALLVGIPAGVFTPSEIGAFAVFYAVVVGVFLHKELTWKGFEEALSEGVLDVGIIMFVILMSRPARLCDHLRTDPAGHGAMDAEPVEQPHGHRAAHPPAAAHSRHGTGKHRDGAVADTHLRADHHQARRGIRCISAS